MKFKYELYLLIILPIFLGCEVQSKTSEKPKSIILFIGDGMGVAQVTTAIMNNVGSNFMRFTNGGLILTASTNSWITDSAASATAISTGVNTYNKAIGVDADQNNLKLLVDYASEAGKSFGIIATSSITHATPAAFYSNNLWRNEEYDIALQLSESEVDVIIGGGFKYFLPENENGKRKDGRNLLNEMKDRKFSVVFDMEDLMSLDKGKTDKVVALLAYSAIDKENNPSHKLADMTRVAIQILKKNGNGFFLMVEGAQIDWKAHDNEYQKMLFQLEDFNEALGVALDYAETDNKLLILVTADHETGGLTLLQGRAKSREFKEQWSTNGHSGSMVPLLATGAGSELFGGIMETEEFGRRIISLIENK